MSFTNEIRYISKFLILSYIVDWVFIVGLALIGYGFYKITPNHHAFSLTDPSISYPYRGSETVTIGTLVLAALVGPAVIIFIVAVVLTPGTGTFVDRRTSRLQAIKAKAWEWIAGWMGLALALAGVWMATQGLKDLIGKPRPDMLARCNPNLSEITTYAVSGLGTHLQSAPILVSWEICQNKSNVLSVDGFSSFPSAHSSFGFAGLGYLSLWLCSKLSVAFPYLPYFPIENTEPNSHRSSVISRGAAPPVLLMILAFVPTAVACFISASRWFDYVHHGFDILFGSSMGLLFAWVSFRMYHLPIQRGAGWAWGPRSRRRAFFRAFGIPSSLGTDSWTYTQVIEPDNHVGVDPRQEAIPLGDRV